MGLFGKKGKKAGTDSPKAAGKAAPSKQQKQPKQPKQSKPPKPPKPTVPPDIYTLLLGLSALLLILTIVVLGLNYHWYQTTDPAVLPLSTWVR